MIFAKSKRLQQLPPYLFVGLDRMKAEAQKKGVDVIDLGIGDPDLPTPKFIVERMIAAVKKAGYHSYPSSSGMLDF
ncbi:MAG: LL-diaminopimelate aminotransferase, partial [Deltaproteobacteria bacterium]|nr:LL-diaminopimelate aminotransferase [Deltaproteobacteria bacterium]